MWPHKDGLGIRLSYGVDGNGLLVVQNKADKHLELKMKVAKLNQQGLVLHEISQSYRLLDQSFESKEDAKYNEDGNSQNQIPNDFNSFDIPRQIASNYHLESLSLCSSNVYDPTIGDVISIFDLKVNKKDQTCKIFAYRSGSSSNILNLAILKNNPVNIGKVGGNVKLFSLLEPYFKYQTKISIPETIAQICTCDSVYGDTSPFILIRTLSKLYILECKLKMVNLEFKVEVCFVGEVGAGESELESFSDVAFNPWNYYQFAIVDNKGKFAIWNIIKQQQYTWKKLTLLASDCQPDIYDPMELSDWKRICWGKNMNTLLVLSRSSMHEFEIDHILRKNKLMTANTWSRIRDIYRVGTHAFLLTSKELIWFDVGDCLTRKMSWKLFLNDEDPSFRLSITTHNDSFICLIYSQISPLLFIYNFSIKDGIPFSLQNPYFIKRKRSNPAVQVQLVNLTTPQPDKFLEVDSTSTNHLYYGLIELDNIFKLSITCYSEVSNLQIIRNENNNTITRQVNSNESRYYYKFTKNLIANLVKQMVGERARITDELTIFKKFAFYLGEGALKLNFKNDSQTERRYHSLIDFYPTVFPTLKKVNEFNSMVQQLQQFYESKSISSAFLLDEVITGRKYKSDDNSKGSIVDYFMKIYFEDNNLKQYNELNGLYSLVITLSAALTKAKSSGLTNFFQDEFNKTKVNSSEQIKALIDQWDNDDDNNYDANDIYDNFIPERESFFNHGSKSKSKKNKISNSTNSSTPLSQSTQVINNFSSEPVESKHLNSQKRISSQQVSGSQQRKRKKKRSGFA